MKEHRLVRRNVWPPCARSAQTANSCARSAPDISKTFAFDVCSTTLTECKRAGLSSSPSWMKAPLLASSWRESIYLLTFETISVLKFQGYIHSTAPGCTMDFWTFLKKRPVVHSLNLGHKRSDKSLSNSIPLDRPMQASSASRAKIIGLSVTGRDRIGQIVCSPPIKNRNVAPGGTATKARDKLVPGGHHLIHWSYEVSRWNTHELFKRTRSL